MQGAEVVGMGRVERERKLGGGGCTRTTGSLAALPLHKEDGSGMALLLMLFLSPEILGNMNMQILWPQHDCDMQVRTTAHLAHKYRARCMQPMCSG